MNRSEYLLVHLMEEASEVQKACAKALRFGLDSDSNQAGRRTGAILATNREAIAEELTDMSVIVTAMLDEGVLRVEDKMAAVGRTGEKEAKMTRMYELSVRIGTVVEP